MNKNSVIIIIGVVSILISLSTWAMDLLHLVEQCIYCRNQRTIIGLLGIILLIPMYKYIKSYLTFVFGFFGASVSAAQMFLTIKNHHVGLMLLLSSCALFIIVGLIYLFHYLEFIHRGEIVMLPLLDRVCRRKERLAKKQAAKHQKRLPKK